MKAGHLVLAACLIGLAFGATLWGMQAHAPRVAPADGSVPESEAMLALQRQVKDLSAKVESLERLIGSTAPGVPVAPTHGPAPLPLPETPADLAKQEARYQHLFESDPRAPDALKWEQVIARSLSTPEVASGSEQPTSRSIQCRARLCLVAATFAPGADASEWTTRVAMAMSDSFSNSRVASRTLPSGEVALNLYAYRKGPDQALLRQGF
jgi:hypothetical protein